MKIFITGKTYDLDKKSEAQITKSVQRELDEIHGSGRIAFSFDKKAENIFQLKYERQLWAKSGAYYTSALISQDDADLLCGVGKPSLNFPQMWNRSLGFTPNDVNVLEFEECYNAIARLKKADIPAYIIYDSSEYSFIATFLFGDLQNLDKITMQDLLPLIMKAQEDLTAMSQQLRNGHN